jgi:hypothetical protein
LCENGDLRNDLRALGHNLVTQSTTTRSLDLETCVLTKLTADYPLWGIPRWSHAREKMRVPKSDSADGCPESSREPQFGQKPLDAGGEFGNSIMK